MAVHMLNPCHLGENWEFEDSFEYIMRLILKKKTRRGRGKEEEEEEREE